MRRSATPWSLSSVATTAAPPARSQSPAPPPATVASVRGRCPQALCSRGTHTSTPACRPKRPWHRWTSFSFSRRRPRKSPLSSLSQCSARAATSCRRRDSCTACGNGARRTTSCSLLTRCNVASAGQASSGLWSISASCPTSWYPPRVSPRGTLCPWWRRGRSSPRLNRSVAWAAPMGAMQWPSRPPWRRLMCLSRRRCWKT
mmetsp:Transcript_68406/g.198319  ORF Transcript_68406/g.198319 Transcript_68406/m.198319 type:complete len:202 (+) Transcript_68406:489-1094(+)